MHYDEKRHPRDERPRKKVGMNDPPHIGLISMTGGNRCVIRLILVGSTISPYDDPEISSRQQIGGKWRRDFEVPREVKLSDVQVASWCPPRGRNKFPTIGTDHPRSINTTHRTVTNPAPHLLARFQLDVTDVVSDRFTAPSSSRFVDTQAKLQDGRVYATAGCKERQALLEMPRLRLGFTSPVRGLVGVSLWMIAE
ncbi:hypothetical protein DL98DRAFT_574208 [Cadophora sp. DSE1049]|nr:hypothetical protein DL98DRAFT_574208 [Cadophora sp. DSE1049]